MKELYPYIARRKSTRKYEMAPLPVDVITALEKKIEGFTPLTPGIDTQLKIVDFDAVRSFMAVKAPHYLLLASEDKEGYLSNIGFLGQQMDLLCSSMGLGSCWLGMARPAKIAGRRLPVVIMIAFGRPEEGEGAYRDLSAFERKEPDAVYSGTDARLEAARLAPSATNGQRWFFAGRGGKIDVYVEDVSGVRGMVFSRYAQIDIGIALLHLMAATEEAGGTFHYETEKDAPQKKGYLYHGTVGAIS
ncbi:MAG: nitroreductase [Clostridiales bacterium]|nr:nitroreductase [Clostridiales bacterium]